MSETTTPVTKAEFVLNSLDKAVKAANAVTIAANTLTAEIVSSTNVTTQLRDQLADPGGGDVTEPPLPPDNYKAALAGDQKSVDLTWTDPPENRDAYQLEGMPALAADAAAYRVTGLATGVPFVAPRLRRLGSDANSDWVTANPPTILIPEDDTGGSVTRPVIPVYAGPPQGAKTIPANADVKSLTPGDYAMESGRRSADFMGQKPGVRIYAANQYGVDCIATGRVFQLMDAILAGIKFSAGIGTGTNGNDFAGGFVGDNSSLLWCLIENSKGVGAAFGLWEGGKNNKSSTNSLCMYNHFRNNGYSGFGGKANKSRIAYNLFEANNTGTHSDGTGSFKCTRCFQVEADHNIVINGFGTLMWWDVHNELTNTHDNYFDGVRMMKKAYEQRGLSYEWSGTGPHFCSRNVFRNIAVPLIASETDGLKATENIFFTGPQVKDENGKQVTCHLHLRDYYAGRSNATEFTRLRHLDFTGNRRGEPGQTELIVARSNSGDQFNKSDLTSKMGCTFQPECKFLF